MTRMVVDPAFSVFKLIGRVESAQQSLVNHRRAMNLISYEIENAILLEGARGRVFSGFQRMSRFLPQIARYTRMAERAESIYVFGVMDITPPPIAGIVYVPLQVTDQLSREWFIAVDAPDYYSILATEELTSFDAPDSERQFKGIWAFNEEMVTIVQEWLSSLVDARTMAISSRNYQRQISLMGNTLARLSAQIAQMASKPTQSAATTATEVQKNIEQATRPETKKP